MNKTLVVSLAVIGGIVLSALIFGVGMFMVHANWSYSIMGNSYNTTQAPAPRTGVGGSGMMGGYRSGNATNIKPLTVDQAKQAVESYLKRLNNSDLALKEIMIFDNNAYARITEKSTGIGAMELLVDPASLSVFPEYGPNMMWNLKYGHMGGNGSGMMGGNRNSMMGGNGNGMMGSNNSNPGSVSATMTVTSDQAAKIAQQYLDQQFPGYQAATDPDPFYGYYTIDILKDGKPTGMLSVNGFSGQVFLHTWHGTFIEMSE